MSAAPIIAKNDAISNLPIELQIEILARTGEDVNAFACASKTWSKAADDKPLWCKLAEKLGIVADPANPRKSVLDRFGSTKAPTEGAATLQGYLRGVRDGYAVHYAIRGIGEEYEDELNNPLNCSPSFCCYRTCWALDLACDCWECKYDGLQKIKSGEISRCAMMFNSVVYAAGAVALAYLFGA